MKDSSCYTLMEYSLAMAYQGAPAIHEVGSEGGTLSLRLHSLLRSFHDEQKGAELIRSSPYQSLLSPPFPHAYILHTHSHCLQGKQRMLP